MVRPAGERGMALVAVMLMMMLMSALAAGFAVSSRTELDISSNEGERAQVRAAAESGLNEAVVLLLKSSSISNLNGVLLGPDGVVDASSAGAAANQDNGSLATLFGGAGPYVLDARYTFDVRLLDDDDPALFNATPTASELSSLGENGSAVADGNGRFVIRASGFGPGGALATVETLLMPDSSQPAVVMNGSLSMSSTTKVLGTAGSVHANTNLTVANKNVVVAKNATASGTLTTAAGWSAGGSSSGSAAQVQPPVVNPASYLSEADIVLTSTGLVTSRATGATMCSAASSKTNCKTTYGWTFVSASGGWTMNHKSGMNATYYVQGPVTISGSPGSASVPINMTVIATGSITITGSPKITPEAASGLLFVTGGDLKISGAISQPLTAEGRILVREQVQISGSASLKAQLLVENASSLSNTVTANSLGGSSSITYNGTLASQSYTVAGWREG